ncbi:MAG: hypothetical protein AAGF53_02340 [Pseudomonadota bacterium]
MCGGGDGGASDRAEQAKAEERAREQRVLQGQRNIDAAFTQFDNAYYDDYAQSIFDFQTPAVQEEYDRTRGQIAAALAGRGNLESSYAANTMGRLGTELADTFAQIQDAAENESQNLRGRVEAQKSDLYALNQASADPASISNQAIGAATSLAAPNPVSEIGSVFTDFLAPVITYRTARNNSAPPRQQSNAPVASGSGSGRIVR